MEVPTNLSLLALRTGNADSKYLLFKLLGILPILFGAGVFLEPKLCEAPYAKLWHAVVVHPLITLFFYCLSNLTLTLHRSTASTKTTVRRNFLYDAVSIKPQHP